MTLKVSPTAALEYAWSSMCNDAGYTPEISGNPSMAVLRPYFANVDRLICERETELRAMVAAVRASKVAGSMRFYADGIEGAIDRAIQSPRTMDVRS